MSWWKAIREACSSLQLFSVLLWSCVLVSLDSICVRVTGLAGAQFKQFNIQIDDVVCVGENRSLVNMGSTACFGTSESSDTPRAPPQILQRGCISLDLIVLTFTLCIQTLMIIINWDFIVCFLLHICSSLVYIYIY